MVVKEEELVAKKHHQSSNLKHLATALAAAAGLVTAVSALYHKPAETEAQASYLTLSQSLEKVSSATIQNSEDILQLHDYLEKLLKVKEQVAVVAVAEADAGVPRSLSSATAVRLLPLIPTPPLPSAHPATPPVKLKSYADVKKAAEAL